jgi:hypothetical protein
VVVEVAVAPATAVPVAVAPATAVPVDVAPAATVLVAVASATVVPVAVAVAVAGVPVTVGVSVPFACADTRVVGPAWPSNESAMATTASRAIAGKRLRMRMFKDFLHVS